MQQDIKKAIKSLSEKARDSDKSDDAVKFSQAALNLANALERASHL